MTEYIVREKEKPRCRYFNNSYFRRDELDGLVSQILEVYSHSPQKILEIGIGNGFVSTFLKKTGFEVTTLDINEKLEPDIVGDITEIDKYFTENSFDLILCAEVLEHIQFEYFEEVLHKLSLITKSIVIITLPISYRILFDLRISVKIPFIPRIEFDLFITIPRRSKWAGHCWEIDYNKAYSLRTIRKIILNYFVINKEFRDKRIRHHYFFILNKK